MNGITLTIFQIVQHRVITKLIAPFHKLFQTQSGILLRSQNSFRAKSLRLLVNIMNHGTYRLLLRLCIVMNDRLPHNFLFRYARLVAILRKADKQRLKVISPSPVLHIPERLIKGGFKKHGEGLRRFKPRFQPQQRIFLSQLPLPEGLFAGHGEWLFQTERYRMRIVSGMFIKRHPAALHQ